MYGIFLEYNFHQVLRFSSCLLTFTLLAAVVLFNVRVSITGGKLIRDACVWKRNSVEENTPLQELFTVLFYEGYFLLQWKWWIRFFCGNLRTFIVQRSAVQDTLPDKWRQLAGRQRKVLLEVSLWNDDSRMWKFGLVRVVMSRRFTFIQVPLQVVYRQVSLITDTLQVDFQQISLNCCYGSFLSGKNLL